MSDCIFCDIVRGEAPASRVYHDEVCTAFLDIQPVNPGHMLIVPNAHAADLAELDPDTGAHLFRVAQQLAAAVRRSGVQCEGVNLWLADGEAAFQDVFHVHLHVIPRYANDGFDLVLSPAYSVKPERAELDEIAKKIRRVTAD
jgi:histidine triad (HIT) family protein